MAISKIKQTIKDGALGLAANNGTDQHIAIGVSSSGTMNELQWHTDPETVKSVYGTGPLVDKVCYHLDAVGGVVGVQRINSSAAGTIGAATVVRGGAGDSTATATSSGAPLDAYQIKAKITRQGTNLAANTAAFIYSLDDGDTWSAEVAMPTSGIYAFPGTGVTFTWVNGAGPISFKVDDVFSATAVAPGYSATDVNNALDALRTGAAATARFRLIHLVGQAANAAGSATIAAAVAAKMTTEMNNYRYTYIWIEAADDTDANLITAFASFVSDRVNVVAGFCELVGNNKIMKRHVAWPLCARRMAQTPQRDLARTANGADGGALPGVRKLYRDEYVTPGLDDARFSTARTWPGEPGFFAGGGRLMYAPGSDYQKLQYRELMDIACTENYRALFPYMNDDDAVDVDLETGLIEEESARRVEKKVDALLAIALTEKRWVTSVSSTIKRDESIISTSTLKTKVRIVPKAYVGNIETEIGFSNPAFRAA